MILLVEDNPGDVMLFTEMMQASSWIMPVEVAQDGEEALTKLQQAMAGHACFDAIVLDLNLPRVGGFEVLERLQSDALCPDMVRIILSSSALAEDQSRAHQLGADGYFVKPHDFSAYGELLSAIKTTVESGRQAS